MTPHVDRRRFDPDVVRHLGRLDFAARLIASGLYEGSRRSRRYGFSTEFNDFVPYVPGDDIRALDWRVYARSDRLFVRRYEAEAGLEHVLVLDASASMAWQWKDSVTKLQYAANMLAAIGFLCMRTGDRVALMADDTSGVELLTPRSRSGHLDRMFSVLESLSPGKGETLSELVDSAHSVTRHHAVYIVFSDLEEPDEKVAAALRTLAGVNGRVCLFHVLDRWEEEYPFDGLTHLEDAETGELLQIDPAHARKVHAEGVQEFRSKRESWCREYGIAYHPVNTGMNYVDALLEAGVK